MFVDPSVRATRRKPGGIPPVVLTHEPLRRREDETQQMRDAQNEQPQEVSAAVPEVVRDAARAKP